MKHIGPQAGLILAGVVLAAVGLVMGCSSGSGGGALPVDLNGSWVGGWTSLEFSGQEGSIELALVHDLDNNQVSGEVNVFGSPCITTTYAGNVNATVDPDMRVVQGEIEWGGRIQATLLFSATINGDNSRLTGTYDLVEATLTGGCESGATADDGVINAVRSIPAGIATTPAVRPVVRSYLWYANGKLIEELLVIDKRMVGDRDNGDHR